MSNFNSAPDHHRSLTGLEMAAIGGLIQQRQQINLQKDSIAVQQHTQNLIGAQLNLQLATIEEQKREKILDIWRAEFIHRGLSPLEAHKQVENELAISDLLVQFQILSNQYLSNRNHAISQIKRKRVQRIPNWLRIALPVTVVGCAVVGGIFPSDVAAGLFGNMLLLEILISVFFIYRYRGIRLPATEEEEYSATIEIQASFVEKLKALKSQLDELPESQLEDDSKFREMISNLTSNY
jgi:hypothetical protein